jgi:hypothetical protein
VSSQVFCSVDMPTIESLFIPVYYAETVNLSDISQLIVNIIKFHALLL